MTTQTRKLSYGSNTSLTVTNLNSLASSATVGWQSVRIDNTSTLAIDYYLSVKLTMANTAPANDKAGYIFLSTSHYDGSAWLQSDGGTATLPGGTEAAYTIASPNNLVLLDILNYTTQQMVIQKNILLSQVLTRMPQGFQIIIVQFTGAALASSGNAVQYIPITETIS